MAFVPKSGRLVSQPQAPTVDTTAQGFQWQDILPIVGGIGGSFIPGIGTVAGAALGAGAGKLLERGVSAARGEEGISLPSALGAAGGEAALFGTLGLAGKGIMAATRTLGKTGGMLPKVTELVTGTPRTGLKTAATHPELVQAYKVGQKGVPDIVDKLTSMTKTAGKAVRSDYQVGIGKLTQQHAKKTLDTKKTLEEINTELQKFGFPVMKTGRLNIAKGPIVGENVSRINRMLQEITSVTRKGNANLEITRNLKKRLFRLGRVSSTPENETMNAISSTIQGILGKHMNVAFKGLEQLNKNYASRIKDVTRLRNLLGETSKNPDTAEAFVKSLLRKSTEVTPQTRFASREMIQRLEKETGESIVNELEAFDIAREATRPFSGAIGQPLVTARDILKKGAISTAQKVGRVKEAIKSR